MAQNGFTNLLWFLGVVEDRRDPRKMGRVRVRCFDIHPDSKDDVPTEDLPWAIPVIGSYDINYKPPIEGSWVFGFFLDGKDAQHPMLLGVTPGMPTSFPNSKEGFNGASDINPHPSSAFQPDISRLARGEDIAETHVAGRYINQELCPGYSWSEPKSPYNAEYPYNKVQETESGHVLEMDDTPGSERINLHHRTGTFIEIGPTGTQTNKIVGDNVVIMEKNGFVYIEGKANVIIKGSCNITIEADCNITVDGDMHQKVHGDYRLEVGGGIYMNSGDIFEQKSSAIRQEAYLDSYNLYAKRNIQIQAHEQNITFHANTGYLAAYAKTDLRFENGRDTFFYAAGETHIKSTGNFAAEAARIDMNTSGAVSVDPDKSGLGRPSGAKPAFRPSIKANPITRKLGIETEIYDEAYSSFTDIKNDPQQDSGEYE